MSIKLKNLHILIVEDLQPVRDLLTSVLKTQGVGTISYAADGEKGYDSFCRLRPDIVITDWYMPKMDGIDLTKLIRTSPRSPDKTAPIIMMTGYGSPSRISKARDSGVTEFIIKPFAALDISKRIMNIIKSPRDFIITPTFAGPDRRRKRDDATSINGENKRINPEGYKEKIVANHILQAKVGMGSIEEEALKKSQSLLEKHNMNFKPIAKDFLEQFKVGIDTARGMDVPLRKQIESMIDPVMQIKANSRIFHYDLMGDLSSIMLNFLEGMNELDKDALDIVEAHYQTLHRILYDEMQGDGGTIGSKFETELDAACKRYVQSRILRQKEALQKAMQHQS